MKGSFERVGGIGHGVRLENAFSIKLIKRRVSRGNKQHVTKLIFVG